jgi:hypothetical protein
MDGRVKCSHCGREDAEGVGDVDGVVECYEINVCTEYKTVVRALTAQAWAVACAIEIARDEAQDITGSAWRGANMARGYIASELPAPADLAAELLG